jgi:hypothetical protein
MKSICSMALVLAYLIGMSEAVMAAPAGGTVARSQGQPVAGVQIIAKDATGHVVGQATTGSNGAYDILGLQSGNYNFMLDPGSSGFQGQTVASYVGPDGICLNWGVSTTSPAVATAQPGSTCQPVAAAAWDPAPWVGAGAVVLGGTAIGLGVGLGSGSDHSGHRTSKSTGE